MHKKEYIKIAEVLKRIREKGFINSTQLGMIIDEFAHTLEQDNPRFSWEKFQNYILK